MIYRAAHYCMKGGRSYNEDSIRYDDGSLGFICVVADGLGGHGGGEIASSLTVETLVNGFKNNPDIGAEAIRRLFEATNREVLARQIPSIQMKSTAVALFCTGTGMTVAHVGDSRFYYFSQGRLIYQTKDHSVSQMAVLSGEISSSQIRFHEDRNKVLRALGSDVEVKPEIQSFSRPEPSDVFLLCTDGFWEYVLEEEMEIDLAKAQGPQQWLDFMVARLGGRINGKNDNFTAGAIFVANSSMDVTVRG